jgi:hypothetical protein
MTRCGAPGACGVGLVERDVVAWPGANVVDDLFGGAREGKGSLVLGVEVDDFAVVAADVEAGVAVEEDRNRVVHSAAAIRSSLT